MPKPDITRAEIEKIADLASLELSDEEKRRLEAQFREILAYFGKIDEAPLPPLHDHPTDEADHLRDDEPRASGVSPADFSPHLEDGFFKVPKVIE